MSKNKFMEMSDKELKEVPVTSLINFSNVSKVLEKLNGIETDMALTAISVVRDCDKRSREHMKEVESKFIQNLDSITIAQKEYFCEVIRRL